MGKEWKIEMNGISLNGFKVIHGGIVLNALALKAIKMRDGMDASNREIVEKPIWLEALAINEDGNIVSTGMKHGPFSLSRLSQSSQAAAGHTVNGSEYRDDLY